MIKEGMLVKMTKKGPFDVHLTVGQNYEVVKLCPNKDVLVYDDKNQINALFSDEYEVVEIEHEQ